MRSHVGSGGFSGEGVVTVCPGFNITFVIKTLLKANTCSEGLILYLWTPEGPVWGETEGDPLEGSGAGRLAQAAQGTLFREETLAV